MDEPRIGNFNALSNCSTVFMNFDYLVLNIFSDALQRPDIRIDVGKLVGCEGCEQFYCIMQYWFPISFDVLF